MKLDNIRVAQNGFVLEDSYGNVHIAKTLLEAAQVAGETVPSDGITGYDVGRDAGDLIKAKERALEGYKIDAIKHLRNTFTPRLGLREAKELLEILCGC